MLARFNLTTAIIAPAAITVKITDMAITIFTISPSPDLLPDSLSSVPSTVSVFPVLASLEMLSTELFVGFILLLLPTDVLFAVRSGACVRCLSDIIVVEDAGLEVVVRAGLIVFAVCDVVFVFTLVKVVQFKVVFEDVDTDVAELS